MRVVVAGASDAIGMAVVRLLRHAGHEVVAVHRAPEGRARLAKAGAAPVQADVLDQRGLAQALTGQRADAVIAELTALEEIPFRHADMAATNRLRVEGTMNLLAAAQQLGARRFITQSMVLGYGFGDWGGRVLTEAELFAPPGNGRFEAHLAALRANEQQVLTALHLDGIALRYGQLYGAGPASDALVAGLRRRRRPVTGASGPWPWVYIDDAASATLAALELGERGTAYNITDDEPVGMSAMLVAMAAAVGAPRPWTVPDWLLATAPVAKTIMTGGLRVSNTKAKAELDWTLQAPSYREGLRLMAHYYRP
jgi:nucleoside-diphosphate-sugar epimerase